MMSIRCLCTCGLRHSIPVSLSGLPGKRNSRGRIRYPFSPFRWAVLMVSYDYDSSYAHGPALPVVELYVRPVAATAGEVSLNARVDSGADATILPLMALHDAHVEQVRRAIMRWGSHTVAKAMMFIWQQ